MATSSFKSTTQRTPVGKLNRDAANSASTNRNSAGRRSRSVSRFSHRLLAPDPEFDEAPAPKGKFVSTVRGPGFPEISLDDLAIEFFDSRDRGRSGSRNADVRPGSVSQRRGRSVSRQGSRVDGGGEGRAIGGNSSGGGKINSESNSRRRRSVSVVRCQISDSESDLDPSKISGNRASMKSFSIGNNQTPSSNKQTPSNHRQVLRRSLSQKDLKSHDGYSSQSSVLTDDEGRDVCDGKNGVERTIRAVYAQKKAPVGDDLNSGFCEAMRKELKHAVEEIRMELEQAIGKTKNSDLLGGTNNSDVLQAVSIIRRNYSSKLERSEKRKQDLLAEIVLEEQRGRELSKIVKELLPDPKNTAAIERPPQAIMRSNDRNRMSKRLNEEAEKYIEDFISSVEDTDISSLDGERSDTSSSLGGITKSESFQSPAIHNPRPVETDGVFLPWLQWETGNDASPLSRKTKTPPEAFPKTILWAAAQEVTSEQDISIQSISSHGSWSPGVIDGPSMNIAEDTRRKFGSYQSQFSLSGSRSLRFDVDEYLNVERKEDILYERLRQHQRINSGGLLLCNQMFL